MQLKKNQLQSQLQLEKNIGCNPRMQLERISAVVPLVTLEKMLFKYQLLSHLQLEKYIICNPTCKFFEKIKRKSPLETRKKYNSCSPTCNWKKYHLQP
jgi:hypothetical protein